MDNQTDLNLSAQIVRTFPLLYSQGSAPGLDRPAHVRSASGIAWVKSYFVVVQDDANFIALVDSSKEKVAAVTLPAGEGGKRQFDDLRGNKKFKMDLESCVIVPHEGQDLLLTFGSGSNAFREKIVILRDLTETPEPEVYDASELYTALRSTKEFAGSEMNIEGAVYIEKKIRLFNRGNGASSKGDKPVNSSCDLNWQSLHTYLMNPKEKPPLLENIVRYDLGTLGNLPLGFTDATNCDGKLFFSAAAEDSPDAQTDGEVAGSVLGVFDEQNKPRWTEISYADGNQFRGKVEGITFLEKENHRVFVVIDQDSPNQPSELCEVRLIGSWFQAL
jgi:hypothetical protein